MHEYSAGSIVYRIKNNKIEFLLVQSRLNRTWDFPKGHLEKDENNVQAAQREVYEEVGLKPDYDFNFEESITYKIARDRLKTVTLFLSKFFKRCSTSVSKFFLASALNFSTSPSAIPIFLAKSASTSGKDGSSIL